MNDYQNPGGTGGLNPDDFEAFMRQFLSGDNPIDPEQLAEAAGTDTTAVAVAWLLHHPARVLPVMGTNQPDRIARFSDALRVPMDRQTWFELYELANGHEVP